MGESCISSADCSVGLTLSCGWSSDVDEDMALKTCIPTAKCGTDLLGGDSGYWVCADVNIII